MSENKKKLIPQEIWDQLETFMGEKLSSDSVLYEQQLHEIIIEFLGCMTRKSLFLDIVKVSTECLMTWAEED